jgi:hypothetical protein
LIASVGLRRELNSGSPLRAAVAVEVLLDAAAALVEGVAGESDHVKRCRLFA